MTAEQIAERLAHVPEGYRGLFGKIYRGETGRAARVKAKCLDCCGYQRVEVRECGAVWCPLWEIRPYQGKSEEEDEESVNGAPCAGPVEN